MSNHGNVGELSLSHIEWRSAKNLMAALLPQTL
jgi:hypothetical protein